MQGINFFKSRTIYIINMMDIKTLPSFVNAEWTLVLGLFIVSLFVFFRYVKVDRSRGLPPGPRFRVPLVGNMYAVTTDMRQFLRKYRKKYGDIYCLYFGNRLVIIIAGFDYLRDAFSKRGDVFSDRPLGDDVWSESTEGGLGKVIAHLSQCFL